MLACCHSEMEWWTYLPLCLIGICCRGMAKRLIRFNWIGIWGVQTIHRFGQQLGPGKRYGGSSTAEIHVFSVCVCLDGSGNQKNTKTISRSAPYIQNTGQDITNKCKLTKKYRYLFFFGYLYVCSFISYIRFTLLHVFNMYIYIYMFLYLLNMFQIFNISIFPN
jgi:hypothetical protein